MKNILNNLVKLQEKDYQIYEFNLILEKFPSELESLKEKEKLLVQELDEIKKQVKNLEITRKNKEIEIDISKEKVNKYDNQLFKIKENSEYKSMLKQIDDSKKAISIFEDEVLEILEKLDKITVKVKEKELEIIETRKILLEKQNEVNSKENNIKEQLRVLKTDRENIAKEIDKKILFTYENILKNRKDKAIVPIKDECCSACNMMLLAHIIDEAKSCNTLITCDTCSRILYDMESLESFTKKESL